MSPAAETIIHRLDAARQKWWFLTLLTTTTLAACTVLGVFLVCTTADAMLRFSQSVLIGMLVAWLAITAFLVFLLGRRLLRSQRSLEATARRVEAEFPELGSNLINLIQLAENHRSGDPAFCEAAIREAVDRVQEVDFGRAATRLSRRRRFRHCMETPRDMIVSLVALALLVGIAILAHQQMPGWSSAVNRLLNPWQFRPMVGRVEIVRISPDKDSEVLVGSSLEIVADINNPENQPHRGQVLVTVEGESETAEPMIADELHRQYKFTVPSITKPLSYRLEIGDSQTKIYKVGIREKPTVAEVKVIYHAPEYLGQADQSVDQKQADLEAAQYSIAELQITPSVPIADGYVQLDKQRVPGRVEDNGRRLVIERLPMLQNGTFTIAMVNDAGHSDPNPRVNRIRVLPDQPPSVELRKPPRESTAAPDDQIEVTVSATDDHALDRIWLETKTQAADADAAKSTDRGPAAMLHAWTDLDGAATAVRRHKVSLKPLGVEPGQTILFRAVAQDRRKFEQWGLHLKPQEAASAWHAVRIIATESRAAAALEQIENLRAGLWKIFEKQTRSRMQTAEILKRPAAEQAQLAGDVRAQQIEILKASVALVKTIGAATDEDRVAIKRVLGKLSVGEMVEAVRQCDGIVGRTAAGDLAKKVPSLVTVEDQIIEKLRKLLDAARLAESELLSEMKKRPGAELPEDVKQKLQEARDKLDKFLEQQKKVIEASENLAKKPVEDYTEEEQQLLKSMAAAEDDWSKFMKELHTDLSKLPEQDFSNASMLKELVEIQTELKMAADALTKKSADIAVPLEQLGYEKAEDMKTNFEKWLPDSPDREKWSQEEALTDADKEAPMAELPGELEDIVGDLMEQEEDLFEEMEDVTSSAVDSADKGAGWDALDGPISNMSAKGVTGNRLPNTSEIGGRSGEGRSGKSSGEFVGDEAIGKGGRQTPSRLTPDPFVKGQIKDHSKDPVGGATGGGKESGQGGEGLEGPSARSPGQRDVQRLAGKQAALRNKAEAVDLQFRVSNFHHTDLKKMIGLMGQVERDLKSGRYQNALRQRKVLADSMGNVKQYLEGEFEVRQDRSSNLPADIQREILGGMQDPSPSGWEELNQRYFGRLSEGGNEAGSSKGTAEPIKRP